MIMRLDARSIPPTLELLEADDFDSLKTVVVVGSHNWVSPETLEELGTDADQAWCDQLAGMIAFAARHGWTDEHGRVRSHVELFDDRAPPADDS